MRGEWKREDNEERNGAKEKKVRGLVQTPVLLALTILAGLIGSVGLIGLVGLVG